MLKLNENAGRTKDDLDKQSIEIFGAGSQYLSKGDASAMIENLLML